MIDRRNDIPDGEFGGDDDSGPPIALILAGVVAILCLIFVIQNGEKVTAQFLWVDQEIRLWVAIVISIVLGILLDRLFSIWWRRTRRDDD
ncbi:hypothetical protein [Ilumatobacter sp.]|uniref:hypothetical protein n=1 Tax=Ilumatobacter sp. TaxID=1967498 RepID=UPI003C47EC20